MPKTLERIRQVMAERHIGIVLVGTLAFMAVSLALSLLNVPFGNVLISIYNQHRNAADTSAVNTYRPLPGVLIFRIVFEAFLTAYVSVFIYWWIYSQKESFQRDDEQLPGEHL